jgi:hypothetical protein
MSNPLKRLSALPSVHTEIKVQVLSNGQVKAQFPSDRKAEFLCEALRQAILIVEVWGKEKRSSIITPAEVIGNHKLNG